MTEVVTTEETKAVVISDKQKAILNAAAQIEQPTVATIAKFLSITAPAVTGTMAALKKNGCVTITEGVIAITEAGKLALTAQTAEQNVAATTVAKIETPSVPKAQQTEGATAKAPRTATSRTDSKASKAQAIFDEFKNEKRAVLMAKLMNEAGLTQHGANTYIYNMRKKAGMVTPRGTVAAPAKAAESSAAETASEQAATEQLLEATIDPETPAE